MHYLSILRNLLRDYSGEITDLTEESTFSDLKMDSYDIVEFMLKAEEAFNVTIPDEDLSEIESMGDVIKAIRKYSRED